MHTRSDVSKSFVHSKVRLSMAEYALLDMIAVGHLSIHHLLLISNTAQSLYNNVGDTVWVAGVLMSVYKCTPLLYIIIL